MITIRYGNFILNGKDMSGKEASVTREEADKLVRLGYAKIVEHEVIEVRKVNEVHEVNETPRAKRKRK